MGAVLQGSSISTPCDISDHTQEVIRGGCDQRRLQYLVSVTREECSLGCVWKLSKAFCFLPKDSWEEGNDGMSHYRCFKREGAADGLKGYLSESS